MCFQREEIACSCATVGLYSACTKTLDINQHLPLKTVEIRTVGIDDGKDVEVIFVYKSTNLSIGGIITE